MKTLAKTTQPQISGFAKVWQRMPVLLKAILMCSLVGVVGANGVSILAMLPAPLALIASLSYLFLFWKFFSGEWGPKKTAEARKKYFRAGSLSPRLWKWSLLLAASFVLVFQSGLVVTFRLVKFPADAWTQGLGLDSIPLWAAWSVIIIAAFSAGLTEEAGFRGYGLVPLEKRYGPVLANIMISVLFVVFHLNQAWAPQVLLHLFVGSFMFGQIAYATGSLLPGIIAHTVLDIFNFSYWWTDIAGRFEHQPIAITGLDLHFLVWSLLFSVSVGLFVWVLGKAKAVRLQS